AGMTLAGVGQTTLSPTAHRRPYLCLAPGKGRVRIATELSERRATAGVTCVRPIRAFAQSNALGIDETRGSGDDGSLCTRVRDADAGPNPSWTGLTLRKEN